MDAVIAAMEVRHPHLTTQKSFYVEISRARDREMPVPHRSSARDMDLGLREPAHALRSAGF